MFLLLLRPKHGYLSLFLFFFFVLAVLREDRSSSSSNSSTSRSRVGRVAYKCIKKILCFVFLNIQNEQVTEIYRKKRRERFGLGDFEDEEER